MSEAQKELEKAKTYESDGNFDKAARSYLKVAKAVSGEQSVKLYNKAFFTSRKSANTHLMYSIGKAYYDVLQLDGQNERINELIPTFLEITGRMRDQKAEKSLEEAIDVLNWTINLYELTGNADAAFETSLEAGDRYFSYGQELLSSTHLLGKDEKWQRGLDLFYEAINAYKQVRLDKEALERILIVKLEQIEKLIDIGRHKEGIESTSDLLNFFSIQEEKNQPYSKKDLTFKIAQILALKSLEKARNKEFEVANLLQNSAKAGFESSGNFTSIPPFLWSLSQVYDELGQKELFFELIETTFETSLTYKDEAIQSSIFEYLEERGINISENIINSRMLMVKKGQIEFDNHEGLQYFLKSIDLAKKINNTEIQDKITNFLFQYAQIMYDKKLKTRSLPYFEFCAQIWWNLPNGSEYTKEIVSYLERKYNSLLEEGKLEDAGKHLSSIVSIHTYIGEAEKGGDSALSFAQIAGNIDKNRIEQEFLELAFNAFSFIDSKVKLQSLLNYIIQRSDPLFNEDSKFRDLRERFIELANSVAAKISQETHGEFLQASTFKSINSGLVESGIELAEKAFTIQKKYNPQLAADLYFKVGSLLIETNMEKAMEFITNSTRFAVEHESLQELVDRNLNYLIDIILSTTNLPDKLFLVSKLDKITNAIDRKMVFIEFLITFTQNLAKSVSVPEYYTQMKYFLEKSFSTYYSIDKKHEKLDEIISWTNQHILEQYKANLNQSLFEMTLLNMKFHEMTSKSNEFKDFFLQIFEIFVSSDDYNHAMELYRETDQFLERLTHSLDVRKEVTEKVVMDLTRNLKPKIKDEKFEEAWPILESLFSILKTSDLRSQAVTLYHENAVLFANTRLDLALTMWTEATEIVKSMENSKSILSSISNTILEDIMPIYIERNIPKAVNQLYTQAIEINELGGNIDTVQDLVLKAARYQLTIGDYDSLIKWGIKGFKLSTEVKNDNYLQEYSNIFFAIGTGLLREDPEIGVKLIETASNLLRDYGSFGFNQYCIKMTEIYEELYKSPVTQELAQLERERILKHFKDTGNKKEEGNLLLTSGKLAIETQNFKEGFNLITQATDLYQEIEDEDGLSEAVSYCLKMASAFGIGTNEYEILFRHAARIQEGGVEISEEKTQDAFIDLFDGMLEDMTSLMDPKERMKRKKAKKKR